MYLKCTISATLTTNGHTRIHVYTERKKHKNKQQYTNLFTLRSALRSAFCFHSIVFAIVRRVVSVDGVVVVVRVVGLRRVVSAVVQRRLASLEVALVVALSRFAI